MPFAYFLYDSAKLGQVRNFATSAQIQIMVVTVGAINKKDVNNLYKDSEKTGGEKPIDLIKATRPIVIVDEPQSVDGGLSGAGKQALDAMNPLCTLRYSATHVDKHHMVYRLDAVDAYERRLVKQIEVASATVEDAHNRPYVRLVSVSNKRGSISARVELDVETATGAQRREVTVYDGDDLEQTTRRAIYRDCRIGEISGHENEFLSFVPGGEQYLRPGRWGDVDPGPFTRNDPSHHQGTSGQGEACARRNRRPLSIKWRTAVRRRRNPVSTCRISRRRATLANHPDYRTLFQEVDRRDGEVHEGYFSIDKKSRRAVDADREQSPVARR